MSDPVVISTTCEHTKTTVVSARTSVHVGFSSETREACDECISVAVAVFEAALRERLIERGFKCRTWEEMFNREE